MQRLSAFVVAIAVVLGLCAASASASASHKPKPPAQPSVAAIKVLPVISCSTTYGSPPSGTPFVAHQLASTVALHGVSYYSNGQITVLGPSGWACSGLVAGDGGQALAVYPPGKPDYAAVPIPKGAQIIRVLADYTGHIPGASLVCGFFPQSAVTSYLSSGNESCAAPAAGEQTATLTSDVVTFSDPAGVSGSGAGSGASLASVGAVVYPQLAYGESDSVNVSLLSCTLPKSDAELCKAIEGDFLVRNQPTYIPQNTG